MNNARRKEVRYIVEQIYKTLEMVDIIRCRLEDVAADEGEALDNIPENLQGSERYEKAETALEALNDGYDVVDEIFDDLEDLASSLESAIE